MEIPLVSQQGKGFSSPENAARTINLYQVIDPAGKRGVVLRGTPGCALFSHLSFEEEGADYPYGPIRGAIELNGIGYVIAGDHFVVVYDDASFNDAGTLDLGTGPVTMDTNGFQVAVCDGSSVWIYDIASEVFAQITDEDFEGAATFACIDGFGVYNKPGTGQFFVTSLLDFSSVDALDFATAESSPDDLIRVFPCGGTLWLMGAKSIEPWANSGESFPFARIGSTRIEQGIAGPYAVANVGGTPTFLGDNGFVYQMNGFSPTAISKENVEHAIAQMTRTDDAFAFAYDQEGHRFFCLTFPTDRKTWVYDYATGQWHERSSSGGAWLASCAVKLGQKQLIGSSLTSDLHEIRPDIYDEVGEEIIATHTLPVIWDNMKTLPHTCLEIDVEPGVGLVGGADPLIALDWSDDGGKTWSHKLYRPMGKIGKYLTRCVWNRLGSAVVRNYRISISDPVKRVILGANLNR